MGATARDAVEKLYVPRAPMPGIVAPRQWSKIAYSWDRSRRSKIMQKDCSVRLSVATSYLEMRNHGIEPSRTHHMHQKKSVWRGALSGGGGVRIMSTDAYVRFTLTLLACMSMLSMPLGVRAIKRVSDASRVCARGVSARVGSGPRSFPVSCYLSSASRETATL